METNIDFDRPIHAKQWLIAILLVGIVLAGSGTSYLSLRDQMEAALPRTEPAKILYLLENYIHHRNVQVRFEGTTYDAKDLVGKVRHALNKYYQGEGAKAWVQKYLYRFPGLERGIIYLTFPDGSKRPLRDVLLEDLHKI